MFSQSAEYSLRAVACLAAHGGSPLTTRQIAAASKVPPGYLAKILQALGRAGVVTSQRGLNGGFVLARDPGDMTLLDVVRVADGSNRIRKCPLGIAAHGTRLCPLHRRLDDTIAQAERALANVTLADVLEESRREYGDQCLGEVVFGSDEMTTPCECDRRHPQQIPAGPAAATGEPPDSPAAGPNRACPSRTTRPVAAEVVTLP